MAAADYYTQVYTMFVGYYGRPPAKSGLDYYADLVDKAGGNLAVVIDDFFKSAESQAFFAGKTVEQQVNQIFQNLFGRDALPAGLNYWTNLINNGTVALSQAAYTIAFNAAAADVAVRDAKVASAMAWVAGLDTTNEILTYSTDAGRTAGRDFLNGVTTSTAATQADVDAALLAMVNGGNTGQTFNLTNDTDVATANIFNAPMVFTPDGSDRILSLQDEDRLTGTAGRTDNTLNVTMGNMNADEGTTATTTPYLFNIQNVNIDWTGNTTTLDLRNADATQAVNVKRVTSDATAVTVDNIGTPAADFRVANTASDDVAVTFQFKQGVLVGDQAMALELNDVLANSVTQQARGAGAGIEGFETVNLEALNGVDLANLSVNEMENLNITGSGDLTIVNLTATANEYDLFAAGGIANPGSIGLRTVNAADFTGNLNVDVSAALGGFVDPTNSGAQAHTVITGGSGDDKFWTNRGVAATSATNRDQIDGGAGNNTLVVLNGAIAGNAAITNIQALELREQGALGAVDFDAFDANLASVLLRDEGAGATTFTLNDLGADLASGGNIVLRHGITGHGVQTVTVNLKADTANDTVAITVENDRNTGTTFDYTIDADVPTPTGKVDADQGVENVTINDNDTETNVVTLTSAAEHKGTVTLTGGVAGQSYTVASTLVAKTVDAAAQKSNLVLTVGVEDQAIKLGAGDDLLTFDGLDTFNGSDAITDIGGTDTVRAFPIAAPSEGLSLIGPDGHELAWIDRLDQLPESARHLIDEELAVREFVPTISQITSVSSFSTPSTWAVVTDKGPAQFVLKAEEDIRRLGGRTRLLISAGDGMQFRVPDTTVLDKHSRRLLERFL